MQFGLISFGAVEGGNTLKSNSSTACRPRIVLWKRLVKEALSKVCGGPAGAHLGRMKTLK